MPGIEVNFDGLVGPTHNYAGLSFGNVASQNNASAVSNPKQAALEGLHKMWALTQLGLMQGVLPPQERPHLRTLRQLGFKGTDTQVLTQASKNAPELLKACVSASSMWAANAATVSPSADTLDGKVHFTPANLLSQFHRSLEASTTERILKAIFSDPAHFSHHSPLPAHPLFADEGAANHTRLCQNFDQKGVEVFVYGQTHFDKQQKAPTHYPARQTKEACEAIARQHGLTDEHVVFIQQNPQVIDQGVFHNDVIAVGHQNVLFYHQDAFLTPETKLKEVADKYGPTPLHLIEVKRTEVSVQEAIQSYLFNTQLITLPSHDMAVIAPMECQENPTVSRYLEALIEKGTPIREVHYLNVKQSMQNGGGPACLRLRVALTDKERLATNSAAFLDDRLHARLTQWVHRHYRDRLSEHDLADPQLLLESQQALDELTSILQLGSVYDFQRDGGK